MIHSDGKIPLTGEVYVRMRIVAVLLMIVGLLVVVVAAGADSFGLSAAPNAFGYKQMLGIGIGALLVIGGFVLTIRRQPER